MFYNLNNLNLTSKFAFKSHTIFIIQNILKFIHLPVLPLSTLFRLKLIPGSGLVLKREKTRRMHSVKFVCIVYKLYIYRPFLKTLPRFSAFVKWTSVRFCETDCSINYIIPLSYSWFHEKVPTVYTSMTTIYLSQVAEGTIFRISPVF